MQTTRLGRLLAGAGPSGRALTPPRLAVVHRRAWLSFVVVVLGVVLFGAAALALLWPMLGKPYVYDEVSFAQVAEGVTRTGLPYANVGFMINEKGEIDKQFQYGLWHPPMYVFTLGWWMGVFGVSETSARLFGVFTMLLTALFVALTVRTALRDHPQRDGFALWGAALYVFNPLTLQSALLLDIDGTVLTVMLMALVWLYLVVQNWGWSGRLLLGVMFALALWAKMTTPFFVLPAIVVYRFLQGKAERGVVEAGAIGAIGAGLFLPSWWIVCQITGMPFTMPFEVLYREFLDAAGHGVSNLRTVEAIAMAAQPATRWIGVYLLALLVLATVVRGLDHARFGAIAAMRWVGRVGTALGAPRGAVPASWARPPTTPAHQDGVRGGQGVDLLIVLTWACFIIYLVKTAGEFPKYHIAALPPLAATVALFAARVIREFRPLEVALHPIAAALLLLYFYFDVGEQYVNVWNFSFVEPMLRMPLVFVLPVAVIGAIVARRIAPQVVLLPAVASVMWATPLVYAQSLSPFNTHYFYGGGGAVEMARYAETVLRPDEYYLAAKDVAYHLSNQNYVDQDSLWTLLNVNNERFTGDWYGRPIRVIIIFGRDPFLRQQFYSEFEGRYEVRQVIGDFALLTRLPGR